MAYLSGTLHAQGFGPIFRPERFVGGHTSAYAYVKENARKLVDTGLARIEARLGSPGQRYMVGDGLTTVDFNLYIFYLWGGRIGVDMGKTYPSYARLVREIEGLEAVRKTAQTEGLKLVVQD
jgi:glutathione S-transferase